MKLTVKNPCTMDWDGMSGTERRRFCDQCDKHVHDLSKLTEPEARELLENPGVCARFTTDAAGEVRFRREGGSRRPSTAAAMVLAAVFASGPAMAGGKAAPDAPSGSWTDWLVEWVAGGTQTLGEVAPLPPIEPTVTPPEEQFLLGDVAEVIEPANERTFHNDTEGVLEVRCTDGSRERLQPGSTTRLHVVDGETCTVTLKGLVPAQKVHWTENEARCTKQYGRLSCE